MEGTSRHPQHLVDAGHATISNLVNGKYFSNCKQIPSSKRSYAATIRQRLWNVSEELLRQNELSQLIPEK